ncbi:MAG TPA: lytic transglycosylase domain-containing protein [Symbiobacteriaceae bacterium]|nr:lytic transglycosylase domain-containing protein [Symbiobacteriaceae bacterium]
MRRRWPLTYWMVLVVALAALGYFGGRWALSAVYPLKYREILFARAQESGLSPYLVAAVIRTESGFRPNAQSSQGARGLMQIMPETGEWAARQLALPYTPELLSDPDYNLRLGCWYLATLQEEFEGDMVLALAAYNGGRGNVEKWLRDRQWTGEHHTLEQIPFPETRQYVTKVLRDFHRYELIYANPR